MNTLAIIDFWGKYLAANLSLESDSERERGFRIYYAGARIIEADTDFWESHRMGDLYLKAIEGIE